MKKQNLKTGLNLKKQLVSNLTTDEVSGGVARSTIAFLTCRTCNRSCVGVCGTFETLTRCNVGCVSMMC
ncbi:hypothetical protein IMCC3317_33310 [Kordia antarctica]|uniref:Uncharacterized protein n=1 Tax=Kordia antarctica TaxID=1218801 RepID=A0A7L4ZMJ9_9FLAO|nr:hypothetical protein [Kordia antarctica]QHI37948.1 hypothetical protein IMCC3317_33310 [Kordia antarctica]